MGAGRSPARATCPSAERLCRYRYRIERGEVEAAFAHADIVVEGDYEFAAYQYAMETHTVIAQVERGEITLWATCQHPFWCGPEMSVFRASALGRVRVIVPYLGGGFGSKSYTKMEPIAVALARKAGRPVRIVNRVDESMVTSRRHGMKPCGWTAATSDGTLIAATSSAGSTPAPTPTTARA